MMGAKQTSDYIKEVQILVALETALKLAGGGIKMSEIETRIEQLKEDLENVKGTPTEVYARIVGYYRPVKYWNVGKQSEYVDRVPFNFPLEAIRDCKEPIAA